MGNPYTIIVIRTHTNKIHIFMNEIIKDILNRRGVNYTIYGVPMYTEESVVAILNEVSELNEALTERCKLLQFMVDNGLGEEDMNPNN